MEILLKNAIIHHAKGDKKCREAYRLAINCGILNVALFSNLGMICQATQRTQEAILL